MQPGTEHLSINLQKKVDLGKKLLTYPHEEKQVRAWPPHTGKVMSAVLTARSVVLQLSALSSSTEPGLAWALQQLKRVLGAATENHPASASLWPSWCHTHRNTCNAPVGPRTEEEP